MAYQLGVWSIGEVFAPSRRQIDPEQAARINRLLPPDLIRVGVFVNESFDKVSYLSRYCGLNMVQLHGQEPPEYTRELGFPVIKAFRAEEELNPDEIKKWLAWAYLFDSGPGGTGQSFNWSYLWPLRNWPNIILAGGLNAGNVIEAIQQVRPMAVDVSSGVEDPGGGKNPVKMARFVEKIREVDAYVT